MKNMKKLVSLLLAVCLMASLAIGASAAEPTTVDVSGGTGTSSVSLSSTSDGTLDGDPAATKMNVTIPTILPIAVGAVSTVIDDFGGGLPRDGIVEFILNHGIIDKVGGGFSIEHITDQLAFITFRTAQCYRIAFVYDLEMIAADFAFQLCDFLF